MLSLLQCQCHMMLLQQLTATNKPGIQALADILLSVLCCHSNETRAPTANPPNNAQLDGTPYHSSKLHPGLCSNVGMRRGSDTQTAVATIHFASATPHEKIIWSHTTQLFNHSAHAYNVLNLCLILFITVQNGSWYRY